MGFPMPSLLTPLDHLLAEAVQSFPAARGTDGAADAFHGLHVPAAEVERLLARSEGSAGATQGRPNGKSQPGIFARLLSTPKPAAERPAVDLAGDDPALGRLARAFGLSAFDLNVVVLALAVEVDLKYERVFGYLQDDLTRRRPTVDLALALLGGDADDRLANRAAFDADAALLRHNLVALFPDPHDVEPSLLNHYLKLDDRVVDHILGEVSIDARIRTAVKLVEPAVAWPELGIDDDTKDRLALLALGQHARAGEGGPSSLVIQLHGPDGAGKRAVAEALCHCAETWLLVIGLADLLRVDLPPETAIRLAFREAVLLQTPLYLDGLDALLADDDRARAALRVLIEQLEQISGVTFLAGRSAWAPSGALRAKPIVSIAVSVPGYAARDALWREELGDIEAPGVDSDVDVGHLAGQFRFGAAQIRDAVATARNRALWRDPASGRVAMDDLLAAGRMHSHHKLGTIATHIQPVYGWDDIVLPADQLRQLREICHAVRYRAKVYTDWGFDRKLARGKGVNALFAGPSGTGKTMAAEIIARDLGLDLFKIDLSSVVSKYIGETEKNLERIFREAQTSNAILFFDEADALFGKRSEVKDAHDRYANIEISYLLQRMEEYDGVVILATNLKKNLDDAFVRRLQYTVDFPFPEEADRLRIWRKIWPDAMPRDGDMDLAFAARQFRLTGGNIKNVAVAAAFLGAAEGDTVRMAHLIHATRREYQKMGKLCTEVEFGPYMHVLEAEGGGA